MQLGRALLGASVGGGLDAIAKGLGIQDILKGTRIMMDRSQTSTSITAETTWSCLTWQRVYTKLRDLYNKHALSTPIERIFSEASVGKAYLTIWAWNRF